MGTQQILLIVLSVIIVGVAIAVGISMFNQQAYNSNKTAIAGDAQAYAAQVLQFFKTPVSQGGAGGVATNMTATAVTSFLGLVSPNNTNDNGTYTVTADTGAGTVTITGRGTAERGGKNPQIVTTITYASDTVTAVASDINVGS